MPNNENRKKKAKSHGASRGNFSPARPSAKKSTGGKPARRKPKSGKPISANRRKGFAGGKRPYDYAAYEKEEATKEYMQRLFDKREFEVSERELEMFWQYYLLLRKRNAELDLTRIMGIEATVLKHFIDCAIVARLTKLEGPLLDIGSGPGFPGAPIAIVAPKLHVILAESRGKRVRFLEELKDIIKLDNAEIYPRSVRVDSDLKANGVITRAVEIIPATLGRVLPFLNPCGKVIFMKGPNCGGEISDAQQEFKGVYKMVEDIKYSLPNTNQQRRLVVFQKRDEADS